MTTVHHLRDNRFYLYLYNFNYLHESSFETLEGAVEKARAIGFSVAIYRNGEIVRTVNPI